MHRFSYYLLSVTLLFFSCNKEEDNGSDNAAFSLMDISVGNSSSLTPVLSNVAVDSKIVLTFSLPVHLESAQANVTLARAGSSVACTYALSNDQKTVTLTPVTLLIHWQVYNVFIDDALTTSSGRKLDTFLQYKLVTAIDTTPKFEELTDNELLQLVQQQSFKYFYDFAHPASGMARERNTSGNLVTSGGSGFGIMALVVGMERNFITRQQGINRLTTIITFLEKADRFHGAWAHWMDSNTGKVIPFSAKDNGGDLVETSFLIQGLLTARQYLHPSDTVGNNLINRITGLWAGVEWDWYRRGGQEVLYWHWSPNYGWDMNFALSGYFEQQITYLLAAASPTHGIPKSVYTNGFAQNGNIVRNNTYYGIPLKLGGLFPLFWTHYSYLGLDPRFSDGYADYWEQNRNASLINRAYCMANPRNYVAYGEHCWGLTSSDGPTGYNAHSPANDTGVISPTAALSAFPYTPKESMKALKFFYYTLGDRLWGPYGFYDAFDVTEGWVADSYLAIDQGPIVCMIENHRTELLWNLFMSAPEVQQGISKLGFNY
jgi:hypothetical protein